MTILYNQNNKKDLRKILRKSMPKGEVLVWMKLKNKQTGYKFRRQYGVGKYVMDFYCVELRLGIEVDGATHDDKKNEYDEIRQNYLEVKKIKILRFSSQEVFNDLNGVVTQIYFECQKNTSPSGYRQ